MAKAALEMAAVDAVLHAGGVALADALGVEAASVPAGAVVGCSADPGRAVAATDAALAAGYRRVKVKVAPGADAGPLGAVRERWPELLLQADANGTYGRGGGPGDAVDALRALDPLGLACLEQPLAADDLVGHGALAGALRTPLCLDESIGRPADVDVAAALGAAAMVCLKAACLGGIGPALDALDRAHAAGLGVWCGGMLQTGLGRAVDAALAGMPAMALPGDLGGPAAAFVEEDPFGAVPFAHGDVLVHRGPGVGPRPDRGALRSVVARRHLCHRTAPTA
jgi:O-succinylbenzoate synthase